MAIGMAGVFPEIVHGDEHLNKPMGESNVPNAKSRCFAYVGCRTTKERNARGEGISVYHVDSATSTWTLVQLVKNLVNPSFLILDK